MAKGMPGDIRVILLKITGAFSLYTFMHELHV